MAIKGMTHHLLFHIMNIHASTRNLPVGVIGSIQIWLGGSVLGVRGSPVSEFRRNGGVSANT